MRQVFWGAQKDNVQGVLQGREEDIPNVRRQKRKLRNQCMSVYIYIYIYIYNQYIISKGYVNLSLSIYIYTYIYIYI